MGTRLLATLLLAGLALPGTAFASWAWLPDSAVSGFDDADWDSLKRTTREAFDTAADGERRNWTNEASGNKGAVKPLLSFDHDGRKCRRVAFLVLNVKNGRGVATHSLCAQADGTLAYLSPSEHP